MASEEGYDDAFPELKRRETLAQDASSADALLAAPRDTVITRKHPSDLISSIRARWAVADKRAKYDHIPSSGFTNAIARYEHIQKQAKLNGLHSPVAKPHTSRGLSDAQVDLNESSKMHAQSSRIVPPGFLSSAEEAAEIVAGKKAYFRLQDVTRNAKLRTWRFARCLVIPKVYEVVDNVWIVVRFQSFGYEVAEVQDMGTYYNVVFEDEEVAWELFDDLGGSGWMTVGPSYSDAWFWVTKGMTK